MWNGDTGRWFSWRWDDVGVVGGSWSMGLGVVEIAEEEKAMVSHLHY